MRTSTLGFTARVGSCARRGGGGNGAPTAPRVFAIRGDNLRGVTPRMPERDTDEDDLLVALRRSGRAHDRAVARVHELTTRAARRQVMRMPGTWEELGEVKTSELIASAANEATMSVLAHLDDFEGRSRFTTWVYKFGVYAASTEARRALWRDKPVEVDLEVPADHGQSPASWSEARDLNDAVRLAMDTVLTARQRQVATALLIEGIPIDVLAERMDSSRNSLYKNLHDGRVKLRAELIRRGYLTDAELEVTR